MTAMRMIHIMMCAAALLPLATAAQTDTRTHDICRGVWDNPAMRPFEHDRSRTTVGMGYDGLRLNRAVVTHEGKGHDTGYFRADTYIRQDNAVLWGHGGYTTGTLRGPVWNEVADAELVYPYITADDTGGDISCETYSFGGGYAASVRRWTWGGALGYTAGHYYRDIDPRPRDVTGRLEAAAGIGYTAAGRYVIAAAGELMRYRQTCDIDFKSELGQATIYHLTGLGTDYVRFRGNGMTTQYDGARYAVRLDMAPAGGSGMTASLRLSRLTVETRLDDINKLPMASLWHNAIDAAAGYRNCGRRTSWGVEGGMTAYRRHGSENVFGDAASATYPKIGTVEMFADNGYTVSARGVAEHVTGGVRLAYDAAVACSHVCRVYLEPQREWLVNALSISQRATVTAALGRRCHGTVEAAWGINCPTETHFVTEEFFGRPYNDGNEPLMEALRSDFMYASAVSRTYSAAASVSYMVNKNNVLRLSAGYRHDSYAAGTHGNAVNMGVALIF